MSGALARNRSSVLSVGYLSGERAVYTVTTALTFIALARLLPIEVFGQFAAVSALVAILTTVGTAGLDGVLVDEAAKSSEPDKTIATAIRIRNLGFVVAAILGVAVSIGLGWRGERLAAVAVLGAMQCGYAQSSRQVRLQLDDRFGRIAVHRLLGTIAMNAALISVAIWTDSVLLLAAARGLDVLLTGAADLAALRLDSGGVQITGDLARSLLRRSWPIGVSGLFAAAYLRVDVLMLDRWQGALATAHYAAAVRLVESSNFLATAVGGVLFAKIAKQSDSDELRLAVARMVATLASLGFALAPIVGVLGYFLVTAGFGQEFLSARPIVLILSLSIPAVFSRVSLSRIIILERLEIVSLFVNAVTAFMNVGLNLVLIPPFGGLGAAWATVASYWLGPVVIVAFQPRIRWHYLNSAHLFTERVRRGSTNTR